MKTDDKQLTRDAKKLIKAMNKAGLTVVKPLEEVKEILKKYRQRAN